MDSEYVQSLRYKLQKRLKRLNTAGFSMFHHVLVQTWGFLQEQDIIRGILDDLEQRCPASQQDADKILAGAALAGTTESENVAISYWVIKACVASSDDSVEIKAGMGFTNGDMDDRIEWFRTTFVETLFDFIDEQIDDKRTVLSLILKYKHRCEWFRRWDLIQSYLSETVTGEAVLISDLYEYLHDQGVPIHIEPKSASGRVDLVSAQTGKDRLIADAKIFNPEASHGTSYIARGFRQVYEYTKDYNEQFGYLVIYKTCEEDLSIQTPHQESSVPFVTYNNKTIFFVVIDIFDYPQSASKRGKLKSYEITPEQLVDMLSQDQKHEPQFPALT